MVRGAGKSEPDFVVVPTGRETLRRWHKVKSKLFNVYLHQSVWHDDNRALHDHPWWNVSIVIQGGYLEVMPLRKGDGSAYRNGDPVWWHRRVPGQVIFRGAKAAHTLMLTGKHDAPEPCWSLFITGPSLRDWGFYCARGWISEKLYRRRVGNRSEIGQGCA
ncbi:MAG TPA: hypothetical protein DEQ40_00445 [Oxalobacteraceae bacterium]|nr:hypothetical protein [Oxalobacteraceae bacterium]